MKVVNETDIIKAVSIVTKTSYNEIVNPKRTCGKGLDLQIICMAILYDEAKIRGIMVNKMSTHEIAMTFNKKHRSSASRGVRNFKNLIETNKHFREKFSMVITGIEEILKQQPNGQTQN